MRCLIVFLLSWIPTTGLMAQVRATRLDNRDVWQIENSVLKVTITQGGGHIAALVLKGPRAINPLWAQARPTIEPGKYLRDKHEKIYGGGPAARLLSGLLGHNLCFPYWGDPSDAEYQSGMTYHGEPGIVRWRKIDGQRVGSREELTIAADLSESRTRFTRTLSLNAGEPVVYFDNRAENLSALDRPITWCEHVTVGAPFLKKGVTLFDASLTKGRKLGDSSGKTFEWPVGQAEAAVDLRTVRNVERSGFVNNFLVDPKREFAYLTAVNPEQRLILGYVFRRTDFPWLNVWEANQPADSEQPAMLARGLEFSDTPTHGSLKAMLAVPNLWDVPAYEWLNARGTLAKPFCAFLSEVPEEFQGVADLRVQERSIEIVERNQGRMVQIPFDLSRLR